MYVGVAEIIVGVFGGRQLLVCSLHEFTESNDNDLKWVNRSGFGSFKAHNLGIQTQNEVHKSCLIGIYCVWVCGEVPWWCQLKVGCWGCSAVVLCVVRYVCNSYFIL